MASCRNLIVASSDSLEAVSRKNLIVALSNTLGTAMDFWYPDDYRRAGPMGLTEDSRKAIGAEPFM